MRRAKAWGAAWLLLNRRRNDEGMDPSELDLEEVRLLLAQGDSEKALDRLGELDEPSLRGRCLVALGRIEEAQAIDDPVVRAELALAKAQALGTTDLYLEPLRQAAAAPNEERALEIAAEALAMLGRSRETAGVLERLALDDPCLMPDRIEMLAQSYRKVGRFNEAERLIELLSIDGRAATNP